MLCRGTFSEVPIQMSWHSLKSFQVNKPHLIAYKDLPLYSSPSLDHNKEDQAQMVAFAGRPLTESEKSSTLDPDLNLLLRKFHLLGVASVEYKVSKETCAVISELRSASIRTLIISSKSQVVHDDNLHKIKFYILSDRELEEAVHLARSSGIIFNKEPVAKIEIPSIEELNPPSLSVIDLPETGMNDYWDIFYCKHNSTV
jgi:hypothetical protein